MGSFGKLNGHRVNSWYHQRFSRFCADPYCWSPVTCNSWRRNGSRNYQKHRAFHGVLDNDFTWRHDAVVYQGVLRPIKALSRKGLNPSIIALTAKVVKRGPVKRSKAERFFQADRWKILKKVFYIRLWTEKRRHKEMEEVFQDELPRLQRSIILRHNEGEYQTDNNWRDRHPQECAFRGTGRTDFVIGDRTLLNEQIERVKIWEKRIINEFLFKLGLSFYFRTFEKGIWWERINVNL